MFPEVWRCVVSGAYDSTRATLHGFSRKRLIGERHPALVSGAPEDTVDGVIYLNVSHRDLTALDRFEGDAYVRVAVPVALESGERVKAWAYLIANPAWLDDIPWDPAHFAAHDLPIFLRTHCVDRSATPRRPWEGD